MKLSIVLCLLLIFTSHADEIPALYFSPDFAEVERDSDTTIEVWVDSIEVLKGFSVQFSYDPELIEMNAIREGTLFSSPTFFASFIDTVDGSVKIESAMLGSGRSVSGSGILFFVDIIGKTEGTDTLSFFDLNLRDVELARIDAVAYDGILVIGPSTHIQNKTKIPYKFRLFQNYPNPFNPITNIDFYVPDASIVTIQIINLSGQVVHTPVSSQMYHTGYHNIEFDGSSLASGVYMYRIKARSMQNGNQNEQSKRMILLR